MASKSNFGEDTGAEEVAKMFANEIRGKYVLITGAAITGIGGATALAVASQAPAGLIVTGRSKDKIDKMISAITTPFPQVPVKPLIMDLASPNSVRAAAKEVLGYPEDIDVLINNAGMAISYRKTSEDGIEMQLATNHLGPFLFTNLIMDKLLSAAKKSKIGSTRIVNLTSLGYLYSPIRFSDYNFEKEEVPEDEKPDRETIKLHGLPVGKPPFGTWEAYGQSKTASILFSVHLSKHLKGSGIYSYAVHPGLVDTELNRDLPSKEKNLDGLKGAVKSKTPAQGAATTLVAAFDPALTATSGPLLLDCQVAECKPYASDPAVAEKLWHLSEKLVGQEFTL